MCDKQKSAGFPGILLPKTAVIERGNHGLTRTSCRHNQIASITSDGPLGLQLIQNLLLIGVGLNVHRVDFGRLFSTVLLSLQGAA